MKKILETKRLYLGELNDTHLESLFGLLGNELVHQYFPSTLNQEESIAFYEKMKKRYHDDKCGFWAVIRKEDNIFLGICGLLKQSVDGKSEIEVGYRFLDTFWGSGYATEAAFGCMEYAKNVLKVKSIISLIRDINTPSIKVAERNSLTHVGDTIFAELSHRVYRKQL